MHLPPIILVRDAPPPSLSLTCWAENSHCMTELGESMD